MPNPVTQFHYDGENYVTARYLTAKIYSHLSQQSALRAVHIFTQFLKEVDLTSRDRQIIYGYFNIRKNTRLFKKEDADALIVHFKSTDLPPKRFVAQYRRWKAMADIYPDFIAFDQIRKNSASTRSEYEKPLFSRKKTNRRDYSYSKHQANYLQKKTAQS